MSQQISMDFEAAERAPVENRPPTQPKILSVSDINRAVKDTLETGFKLIWVKGEISNFKAHTSGHFYFSLKDAKAQISAVMFRGFNQGLKFKPRDGMEVLVRGKITVYEPRGNYQMFCEMMEPVGAGALQMAFEQLKRKLEAEGLFAKERKRPLPRLPKHVAVVTSPTGAAIRDILNVLGRRFKGLKVTVVPALVQGAGAAGSIVSAIQLAQKLADVDVMIVGRGGGSIEDMWCFNEEVVARAIAAVRVPVISAVGHEIDFTIADFVADLRAPTPSAAAELVSRNAGELCESIALQRKRLLRAYGHAHQLHRQRVFQLSKRLIDPKRRLQDLGLRCDELSLRLENGLRRYLERRGQTVRLLVSRLPSPGVTVLRLGQEVGMRLARLEAQVLRAVEGRRATLGRLAAVLDSLSPLKVVERGFSITRKDGALVKSAAQVAVGDRIEVAFAKGRAQARVEKVLE